MFPLRIIYVCIMRCDILCDAGATGFGWHYAQLYSRSFSPMRVGKAFMIFDCVCCDQFSKSIFKLSLTARNACSQHRNNMIKLLTSVKLFLTYRVVLDILYVFLKSVDARNNANNINSQLTVYYTIWLLFLELNKYF